jgi:hypothetical protein
MVGATHCTCRGSAVGTLNEHNSVLEDADEKVVSMSCRIFSHLAFGHAEMGEG